MTRIHIPGNHAPSANGLCFLVVEDHDFQRSMMVKMLNALGACSVHAAADGCAGVDILNDTAVALDIIISDLDMPGMDGMEFIRHVGTLARGTSLIIASSLERDLLSAVANMAAAYGINFLGTIEKPVTPAKLEHLLERHRAAAAAAKQPGSGRITLSPEEIREGLRNDEFEPFFQPQIEMRSGRVIGAEALARWRHPKLGIVAPYYFIATLEEAGGIDELTRCMTMKASQTCRTARAAGFDITIAVNVSLKTLGDVTFAEQITSIVRSENVDPRHMVIEVTESAAATDLGTALENLARLRMKGFALAIDDYGTGYSSLAQLTRIPFNELKIDQSFVTNAGKRECASVILRSSLHMARQLKLRAIAEGVETEEDWELLCEMQCDIAQGYFIAEPMSASAFLYWMRDRAGSIPADSPQDAVRHARRRAFHA